MSRVCIRRIGLAVATLTAWFCSNTAWGDTQNNEVFKRLTDAVKEYSATAKEQQKLDKYHIAFALRRAVTAERPGIPYRWNNLNTSHKGEIVLLDFIGPRGHGRLCVDFKHTYYLGGASPIEDEGTVCQNSEGEWDDIIVRAVFKGTGATNQITATPLSTKVVREVQTLLGRLNYNPGPVDGLYGQRTKRAIEYYQRDEGLSITGEVSEKLVASLNRSVSILDGLPSTEETAAVNEMSTETLPSADPGGIERLAMDQSPVSTTLLDTENDSSSASTEFTPVDRRVPQHEQSSDKAGVTAPAQTTKTAERPKIVSVDVDSAAINGENDSSTASKHEDAEVTASKKKSPVSAVDNVQNPIAQDPTKSKTKDQTKLQESTDSPRPLATQVSEGKSAVDRAQTGEKESIKKQDKTPAGEDTEESKSLDATLEPYDSNWFMALLGLIVCGVTGLIAARYLTSRKDRSTVRKAEMEQAAAELDNKIAIVVGQADKGLDKASKLDRDTAARVYKQPVKSVRMPPVSNEPVEEESQTRDDVLVPKDPALQQACIQEADTVASTVEEPEQIPLKEVPEEIMDRPEALPVQQPDEVDSATDSQDIIIQAITEFDELIKETEHVLAMDLEPDSREDITKAIEQATKLIKNAFEKDPVEGDSHKYTNKAIRKATKLIVEVLEEHLTAASQLRVKNK